MICIEWKFWRLVQLGCKFGCGSLIINLTYKLAKFREFETPKNTYSAIAK